MAQDILAARRAIMLQKIADADEKLEEAQKTLDYQLRNSRHLQLLAPIQPKTREHMLLSAARLAAQLKWTRMEIWKLKCHRDILLFDLEEERQMFGLPADDIASSPISDKGVTRDDGDDAASQKSPQSPAQYSVARSSLTVRSDDDSTEVFQTPPTSATSSSFHRPQNSWELPGLTFDHVDLRKASVSSATSNPSTTTSPSRKKANSVTGLPASEKGKFDRAAEVDADEHNLLEQTGLRHTAVAEVGDTSERPERHSASMSADRHDRNKIRRSLQRTLREGAGHISHHRGRKGRDSASSGAMSDDTAREGPDVLSRGTGSFVVHGKKASVITFGNELQMQSLSPEERIRQWKIRDDTGAIPATTGANARGIAADIADFRTVLTARSASQAREHRGSAASASTATARSFRELHRKYSSAQAAKGLVSSGSLALPSDEDSDAAVSFSDGRRTPLPPIEGEPEPSESEDARGDETDISPPPSRDHRQTMFFTPEPASSPVRPHSPEISEGQVSTAGANDRRGGSPLQAVGA